MGMKETANNLRQARELITRPEAWTKHHFAKSSTMSGCGTNPLDPSAKCFCSLGALMCVMRIDLAIYRSKYMGERAALVKATGRVDIAAWNDEPERTHVEVLAAFDKAIAAEEKGGTE